jgi:adenosylhomocysteine nucleosidase
LEQDVWLYVSGMGEARARAAAECLLLEGALALVSWGTAGALVKGLAPGALVLPNAVSHGGKIFPVELHWRERLARRLGNHLPVNAGILTHSTQALTMPAEKGDLHKRTAAVAVDMESATIGATAARARVPYLVVRSIVDPQEMPLPRCAVESVDEYGNVQPWRLLSGLSAQPLNIFSMIRLARHFRAALTTLRTVAQLAGPRLCYEEQI